MRTLPLTGAFVFSSFLTAMTSFAANKDAAVNYYSPPEHALIRLHGQSAKSMISFLARGQTTDRAERIGCNNTMCAFLIDRSGQVFAAQELQEITAQSLADTDRVDPPLRGEITLTQQNPTPPALPGYQVSITGNSAKYLFDFFLSNPSDSPYELKVRGMKCNREPVSDTYECMFRVADNGLVTP